MCIMHFIQVRELATWCGESELSRPQDNVTRELFHKMMLMNGTEDGQRKQVSEQKMIAKWTTSNNTNLVLSRQAPVHATPSLCF
jgi:hypothetical protein